MEKYKAKEKKKPRQFSTFRQFSSMSLISQMIGNSLKKKSKNKTTFNNQLGTHPELSDSHAKVNSISSRVQNYEFHQDLPGVIHGKTESNPFHDGNVQVFQDQNFRRLSSSKQSNNIKTKVVQPNVIETKF